VKVIIIYFFSVPT